MQLIRGTAIILLLCLTAGCASKKTVQEPHKSNTSHLDEAQRLEFEAYFFQANKDKILGNTKEAIENLEKALAVNPKSSACYFLLGQIYASQSKPKKTIEFTLKALELEPDNEWYMVQLATAYVTLKEHENAAKVFQKLTKQNPNKRNYYVSEGLQWYLAKNPSQAIETFDELDRKLGITEESARIKQEIYISMGKGEKAVNELKKLLKSDPGNVSYLLLLADLYMQIEAYPEAKSTYQEVLQIEPENGKAHMGMARYFRAMNDPASTFEELKLAFKDPLTAIKVKVEVLLYYRDKLSNAELKKQVLELAQVLRQVHPEEAGSYAISSDIYFELGDLEQSRKYLKTALDLERADFAAWNKLLLIDEALKNFQYMKEDSEKAISYFPAQVSLYVFGSFASYMLKDYRQMADLSLQGLDLAIFNDMKMQFLTNLGDAYNYLRMYDSSDYYYNLALETDSNNALILNNYAYFLSVRNTQLVRAERLSRKANELVPNSASYLDTYGWILYKMGRFKEAEDFIRRSLDINPASPEVLEHYGDVSFKLGNASRALEYWKKAKEKGSTGPLLNRKIKDQSLYE